MDILTGLGGIGVLIFLFLLFILGVLMPFMVYSAQKYAYKCYWELRELNKNLSYYAKNNTR